MNPPTNCLRVAYIGVKGIPGQAGVDRVVEAIVTHLDKNLYQPTVYCSWQAVPSGVELPDIEIVRIPALPGKHMHALSLFLFAALHCLFFGKFDLIHLHNVEAAFTLPILRLRFSVLSTSHGTAQKLQKWSRPAKLMIAAMEWPYIHLSTRRTCVSKPLTEHYIECYGKPIQYIPNGVELDESVDVRAAETVLSAHSVRSQGYILFAAGRVLSIKGCHLLLEAFRRIDTDLHLVVVGDISIEPEYQQQLLSLADERVHFVSFIASKPTLLGLLQRARLFVFPSLVEAMSMMLLEATSIGVPVICSDIPENTSILPADTRYFESGNSVDLQRQLQWALDHPEAMVIEAEKTRNWVGEKYRWANILARYESLYREMVWLDGDSAQVESVASR